MLRLTCCSSMSIKDKNGFYPLHTHLLNATEGVTLVLLDGYPDACKAKDSAPGTPLHLPPSRRLTWKW